MKLLGPALLSLSLIQVSGCADDDQDDLEEVYGVDPAWASEQYYASAWDTAMYYPLVDPLDDPAYFSDDFFLSNGTTSAEIDPDAAAASAASAAPDYFTPPSCVSTEASGPIVTYEFDDCTGPLGLSPINGLVLVTYANENGALQVSVSSDDLAISDHQVDFDSVATFRADEQGQRNLQIVSNTRTEGRHDVVERQVDVTATWEAGDDCVLVNGSGEIEADGDEIQATLDDVLVCTDRCAESGTVTIDGDDGRLTVTLDGTSTPTFMTDDGDMGRVQLLCTP